MRPPSKRSSSLLIRSRIGRHEHASHIHVLKSTNSCIRYLVFLFAIIFLFFKKFLFNCSIFITKIWSQISARIIKVIFQDLIILIYQYAFITQGIWFLLFSKIWTDLYFVSCVFRVQKNTCLLCIDTLILFNNYNSYKYVILTMLYKIKI